MATLKMGSTTAITESSGVFTDAQPPGIIQVKTGTYTGHATVSSDGSYTTGHLEFALTPIRADSSFFFLANCFFGLGNHDTFAEIGFVVSGASPGGTVTPRGATGTGDQVFAVAGIGSFAGASTTDDWAICTTPAHFLWTPSSDLGVTTRTFSVGAARGGTGTDSIVWNRRWTDGQDARNAAPVSVLTVFEINALAIAD